MFSGFSEDTVQFFLTIRYHNDRATFLAHHDAYEAHVIAPFSAFIETLADDMRGIDPDMEVRPAKCLARIHRDTRFTKDKSPYRDHLWLLFRHAGEPREHCVMYWFELSPEKVNWGLGYWDENRPAMDLLRRRMAAKPRDFMSVIAQCGLEKRGLTLSGDDFKRIEVPPSLPESLRPWYVKKSLYVNREGVPFETVYSPEIADRVREDYLALAPLYKALRGVNLEALAVAE